MSAYNHPEDTYLWMVNDCPLWLSKKVAQAFKKSGCPVELVVYMSCGKPLTTALSL